MVTELPIALELPIADCRIRGTGKRITDFRDAPSPDFRDRQFPANPLPGPHNSAIGNWKSAILRQLLSVEAEPDGLGEVFGQVRFL